jgi:hypothetical protein
METLPVAPELGKSNFCPFPHKTELLARKTQQNTDSSTSQEGGVQLEEYQDILDGKSENRLLEFEKKNVSSNTVQ